MKHYYLAYGSNLNMAQMKWRCPDAKVVGTAVIKDYRLLFKGSRSGAYYTIEKADGYEVPVGVWEVSKADIRNLDMYEGYPTFYYKKEFNLPIKGLKGRYHKCFAYIMHEDRKIGIPSEYYVQTCVDGYEDFGFDLEYIKESLEYVREVS